MFLCATTRPFHEVERQLQSIRVENKVSIWLGVVCLHTRDQGSQLGHGKVSLTASHHGHASVQARRSRHVASSVLGIAFQRTDMCAGPQVTRQKVPCFCSTPSRCPRAPSPRRSNKLLRPCFGGGLAGLLQKRPSLQGKTSCSKHSRMGRGVIGFLLTTCAHAPP